MGASKLEGYDTELIVNGRRQFALGHHARLLILQIIDSFGECNLDHISDQMVLSKSTVNEHVDKLREVGLVEGFWQGSEFLLKVNKTELNATCEWISSFAQKFRSG